MPKHPQDEWLIDRFLRNELTEEETATFEQRSTDPDFQEELALQKDLQQAFQVSGREALKSRFQHLEKNRVVEKKTTPSDSPGRPIPLNRWFAIAASIALVLIAWWWLNNQGSSPEKLYAQYFEPYPNVIAPIQKGEVKEDPNTKAFQLYESQQYQKAIDAFSQLSQDDSNVQFYRALSQMALNQEACIATFQSLSQSNHSTRQAAAWYLALALLKFDRLEESKQRLALIQQDSSHPFYKKASQLLKEL